MRILSLALLVAAASIFLPPPAAEARVMTLTYDGSVSAGTDELGLFGASPDLGGSNFTATFTFDTSTTSRSTDLYHDRIDGGSALGLPTFLTSSITIGDVTQVLDVGATQNIVLVQNIIIAIAADSNTIATVPNTPVNSTQIWLSIFSNFGRPNLERNGTWAATDYVGSFQISKYDSSTGGYVRTFGSLVPVSASLDGGFVPEPSTWAIMLLGFGAVGSAFRRRRSLAA